MTPFDSKIQKVVNLFAHPVWFIVADETLSCSCVDFTSKVPDPQCRKCFGTGHKIQLIKVKAAHQHNKISFRGKGVGFNEVDVVSVYYTNMETKIKPGDIIVDRECVDVVKDVYHERSDGSEVVYWRIETVPKKSYADEIKKLLRDALRGANADG